MSLEAAYLRLCEMLRDHHIESFSVIEEVERLRLHWKPNQAKVILLAESHVWTHDAELERKVVQPDHYECNFVRFIYCLGYGERSLVGAPGIPKNRGTPEYWKLFHDTVYGPDTPCGCLRADENAEARIAAKLSLLSRMKEAGIWLVDASIIGLYRPGGEKAVSAMLYREVLRACWNEHIRSVVKNCSPSGVLVIGKGVNAEIGPQIRESLPAAAMHVVAQPNARMSSEERAAQRKEVYRFCNSLKKPGTKAPEMPTNTKPGASTSSSTSKASYSQRDLMRQLVRQLGSNKTLVCREFANAEREGKIRRKSNERSLSAEEYADALWRDGERKGWLYS